MLSSLLLVRDSKFIGRQCIIYFHLHSFLHMCSPRLKNVSCPKDVYKYMNPRWFPCFLKKETFQNLFIVVKNFIENRNMPTCDAVLRRRTLIKEWSCHFIVVVDSGNHRPTMIFFFEVCSNLLVKSKDVIMYILVELIQTYVKIF